MPRKRDLFIFCIVWLMIVLILGNLYRYADEKRVGEISPNFSLFKQERIVSLGVYIISAYCPCEICCGIKSTENYGRTSSGEIAVEGVTIATDNNIIPIGFQVLINEKKYISQDKGGSIRGNRIDIFFNNHQDALNYGIKKVEIFLILN